MFSRWLVEHWYRPRLSWFTCLLLPFECLYRRLFNRKRQQGLQRRQQQPKLSAPLIIVGNITVGGVGKTPVVLALAEHLKQKGYKPGIISRGYQGNSQQYPLDVIPTTDPDLAGDEPVLLATLSGCPVMVDPDRPNAAKSLLQRHDVDIILADDGLQHFPLNGDIELAVIDGARGLGNHHCLPAGPLREPAERLASVDFVLINGDGYNISNRDCHRFHLQISDLQSLLKNGPAYVATERYVHGVAGIGHPERFFNSLRESGFEVIEHPFPDHHSYTQQDFDFTDDLPIIMTEKDAIKCRQLELKNGYYLPVKAELPDAFFAQLESRLATLLSQRS